MIKFFINVTEVPSHIICIFNRNITITKARTTPFIANLKHNLIKLEDRSQKKTIMFLHSKNKASRKGYKGEC